MTIATLTALFCRLIGVYTLLGATLLQAKLISNQGESALEQLFHLVAINTPTSLGISGGLVIALSLIATPLLSAAERTPITMNPAALLNVVLRVSTIYSISNFMSAVISNRLQYDPLTDSPLTFPTTELFAIACASAVFAFTPYLSRQFAPKSRPELTVDA